MKPALEFLGFTSAALLAHLAVFAATAPDGAASGGVGGGDEVSISAPLGAATVELAAMVRAWERPVTLSEPAPPPNAPDAGDPAPVLPAALPPEQELPRLTAPRDIPSATEVLPMVARELPPLFAMPTDSPSVRPRARPDRTRAAQPRSVPQTAAPSAQRAAGQGAQSQRGAGQAQVQSGSANSASLLAAWGGEIRSAIQRQQRSPGTRATGTVHLRLQVRADGQLAHVSVAQGSGSAALDRAAIQAVQRARFPRAPAGVSGTHQFNLPLSFR